MKNKLHYILLLCVMSLLAFAGCEVHEFPEIRKELVPFKLHLDFNTELPFYKEVIYTRSGETDANTDYDVRYVINAYRVDTRTDSRKVDTSYVFMKSDLENLNYTAQFGIYEGTYDFRVWCDYVNAGNSSDKYYNTSDFAEIILADKNNHPGSNDYRDAFRGSTTATVMNPIYYTGEIVNTIDNQATANMVRPMGKFKFISTDVDAFLNRVIQDKLSRGEEINGSTNSDEISMSDIDISEFNVVFRYNIFMPCSFNMFTDKPADAWTGMSFPSTMYLDSENDNELVLGYDYAFVNGNETTLSISVAVYNKDGDKMSETNPINVPIVRSKLTIVRGEFLTSKATGGVAINPNYDGDDFNIEIL